MSKKNKPERRSLRIDSRSNWSWRSRRPWRMRKGEKRNWPNCRRRRLRRGIRPQRRNFPFLSRFIFPN
jgi:hypothetical protein